MSFADDLKEQFEAERDWMNVTVKVNKKPYTFRITQMDPERWVVATRMWPARPKIPIDMQFGYNLDGLTPVVLAETGQRLDGEDLVWVTPDEWTNLLKAISGGERAKFSDAIFQLNETGPLAEIEELKKALAALYAGDSASPENLESPADDSTDGNPPSSPPTSTATTDDSSEL